MAKKLIYNYTFTPGVANAGKLEITGNYPIKVWQLVTDTGTGGIYPHTFVRDAYAATTGAIEIITGGSGDLIISQSGTTFNEVSGIMTVTTTTNHGLSTGATIKFRLRGVVFACAKDNYATEHLYPRETDPTFDQALEITVVDNDTFTVYVGRPVGGAISSDNEIIYNFADTTKGGSTFYDAARDKTILTFKHDTSHLDPLDELQIFLDTQEQKIDFSETFTDPVSKLRVSNPQNLIDTDFEYGLQPTKWETVELVNNVPAFYSSNSDYSISDVTTVTSIVNSEFITVKTLEPHGLTVGSPIDVQGLSSRTAEGKFLVTRVIDPNTFVYKAKAIQSQAAVLNGSYTVIVPGQFYQGSDVAINPENGIETDGANPSSLTVTTDYDHGFVEGSSFYLTNTIGKEIYDTENTHTDSAPDGRPYIDHVETLNVTMTPDLSKTETKAMTGLYSRKFDMSDVNLSNNSIRWNGHELRNGDVLLYVPPSGDTEIGGLERFQLYYVKQALTEDRITLCEITNGRYDLNPEIDLTAGGTSDKGRHQLILCYELDYSYKNSNNYTSYFRTRYNRYSQGSGWDFPAKGYTQAAYNNRYGYYGLGGDYPQRIMYMSTNNNPSNVLVDNGGLYSQRDNINFTFGKSGTTPDGWDFIEDFNRYQNGNSYYATNYYSYAYFNGAGSFYHYYAGGFKYSSSIYYYPTRGTFFMCFLKADPEADSLYIQNHGLDDGATVTITTTSGDNIKYRNDTNSSNNTLPTFQTLGSPISTTIQKLSNDRVRLIGADRLNAATGEYSIQGDVRNEKANTVYLGQHNLVTGQVLELSELTGGSLPSTTSGVSQATRDSISTVYESVKGTLDTLRNDNPTHFTSIYQHGNRHSYPISSRRITVDGAYQWFYYNVNNYYMRKYNDNGSYVTTQVSVNGQNFRTGQPYDIWSSTNVGGQGYLIQTTPFEQNSTVDYLIEVYQYPNSPGVRRTQWYQNSWGNYVYHTSGQRIDNSQTSSQWNVQLGDGWRYSWDSNYFSPNNSYHGYICLSIMIDNTNWSGYYENDSNSQYYPNSRYTVPYSFTYLGQAYRINVQVPVKSGTTASNYGSTGTVKNMAELAEDIATNIKTVMTNPTFNSVGVNTVFVDQVGGDRIKFKNAQDVTYDFTNSGIYPIRLSTLEKPGTVDGYYSIDSATSETLNTFLTSRVPKRLLEATPSSIVTIDGTEYVNIPNHKLQTPQKITYTGPDFTGITSSTTYYAVVDGPNHFRLAATAGDASGFNAISIGTTSSTDVMNFEIPSIAGISSAQGSVGISSEKTTFTGTNCLFKRFFKNGDIIKITDTTNNPPTYREFTVASVIDDNELTVTEIPGVDIPDTQYYVETKVHPRPDGTFIHRPFDGGVEITAGTSPNSSIVRQTRKYFRYQSGKGIQCSVAINFNPSRLANRLTGTGNTSLPAKTFNLNVNNNGAGSYTIAGEDRNVTVQGTNQQITLMQGDTVNFRINANGHPLWISTDSYAGIGSTMAVTTGVTGAGTSVGTVTWDTTGIATGMYYYHCEYHSSMQGNILIEPAGITTNIAELTTRYPHGLTRNNVVTVRGATESAYNGSFNVVDSDAFSLRYYLPESPQNTIPDGIIEYGIDGYANSAVRCGLFDYQNGMFYEYDGQELYCVRRSSVQQLPGDVRVTKNSNIIFGNETNFTGQLLVGDRIVIRGQSYRITAIKSKTELHVSPAYRGQDASDAIVTKTQDLRIPQSEWSVDKADGTGPSGFKLDITKIQMAYIDYSWYGAGKIRFGFKDAKGHVKYMHEFLHNNRLEEAYMRSGNMPGRYEIENTGRPSFVPSLFHWGTSVIMDGKFDDDKAYLFTAASQNLIFTNGDSATSNTVAAGTITYRYNYSVRQYDFYLRLRFNSNDAGKFSSGTPLYTDDGELNGQTIAYTDYSGGNFNAYIYISSNRYYRPPAVYPIVANNTAVSIGAPAAGSSEIELTSEVPLISIRLSPSVDNNLTGALGAREIINRMQLQLKSLGITVSHDCNVDVILNGASSNQSFENVTTPSLSELIRHQPGDKIIGGTKIFSLRASGGNENAAGKRLSATSDFDLSQITDLGNSILGGDGTFPNGPDLLTIALVPVDTSQINATTPLTVSSRITWTESQA